MISLPLYKKSAEISDSFHGNTCSKRDILYEGHLESKERFAVQRYLLIIGKKKNMQVL